MVHWGIIILSHLWWSSCVKWERIIEKVIVRDQSIDHYGSIGNDLNLQHLVLQPCKWRWNIPLGKWTKDCVDRYECLMASGAQDHFQFSFPVVCSLENKTIFSHVSNPNKRNVMTCTKRRSDDLSYCNLSVTYQR